MLPLEVEEKTVASGALPEVGVATNEATGLLVALATAMVCEVLLLPPGPVTVSVAVYVPADL